MGSIPAPNTQKDTPNGVSLLVPVTGIEPVRILLRGILSYHSYVEGNGMYIHVKESKSCVDPLHFRKSLWFRCENV